MLAAERIALFETVPQGTTSLDAPDAIVFCPEATDSWDRDADTTAGARVAHALFLLGAPKINYALTPSVLGKVQRFLQTGEDSFHHRDAHPRLPGSHPVTAKAPGPRTGWLRWSRRGRY